MDGAAKVRPSRFKRGEGALVITRQDDGRGWCPVSERGVGRCVRWRRRAGAVERQRWVPCVGTPQALRSQGKRRATKADLEGWRVGRGSLFVGGLGNGEGPVQSATVRRWRPETAESRCSPLQVGAGKPLAGVSGCTRRFRGPDAKHGQRSLAWCRGVGGRGKPTRRPEMPKAGAADFTSTFGWSEGGSGGRRVSLIDIVTSAVQSLFRKCSCRVPGGGRT